MSKFYHFSPEPLETNEPLKPGAVSQIGVEVKKILEARRPSKSIPLSEAVYLSESDDPAKHGLKAHVVYVHYAEVVGPYERRDNGWIGELQARHSPSKAIQEFQLKELKNLTDEELADCYWRGDVSPKENWEIVARQAVIKGLAPQHSTYVGSPLAKEAYKILTGGAQSTPDDKKRD